MKERDTLIWKFLDGRATEHEKAMVTSRLEEDPAFKAAFLERQQLHLQMKEEELEQPSMRFAKNIMDQLPNLYRRAVEPLVRPFWIRLFFGSLGVFLIGYFGLVAYTLRTGKVSSDGLISQISERVAGLFEGLPPQILTVVSALCLAYLGLVWLDRQLKKRILSPRRKTS